MEQLIEDVEAAIYEAVGYSIPLELCQKASAVAVAACTKRAVSQMSWLLAHFEQSEGVTGIGDWMACPPVFTEQEWAGLIAESERIMAHDNG